MKEDLMHRKGMDAQKTTFAAQGPHKKTQNRSHF